MSERLYLECFSGISGDMTAAALIDLGVNHEFLKEQLESLGLKDVKVEIKTIFKNGVKACDFRVMDQYGHGAYDHDMEYLHGSSPLKHGVNHAHGHNSENSDEHIHVHAHEHPHEHRGFNDILKIFQNSSLSDRAKKTASKILKIIAEAESQVHGIAFEDVKFHEVGAVDSIIDIAAISVCLDKLNFDAAFVSSLYEGGGTVRCAHGLLPVPVPAVSMIAAKYELPLRVTGLSGEFVTPTGAAAAAAIRVPGDLPEKFKIKKIGVGAGKRKYETPGILRAMIIEIEDAAPQEDEVLLLETNVDDCTGEALGYTLDRLLSSGALDAFYTPVYMKKNRPAYCLTVISPESIAAKLETIIFEETTSIGIRKRKMKRTVLRRDIEKRLTSLGEINVKKCMLPSGIRLYPEHESVVAVCEKAGISYQTAVRKIISELDG